MAWPETLILYFTMKYNYLSLKEILSLSNYCLNMHPISSLRNFIDKNDKLNDTF